MKNFLLWRHIFFLLLGILCVTVPSSMTKALPYLAGGSMVLVGTLMIAAYIKEKQFYEAISEDLAFGAVFALTGLFFLLKGPQALGAVGTVWALIGLVKSGKSLNRMIQRVVLKEPFFKSLLEFLIRLSLSLILLFDPFEKITTHIVILGLELIFSNIRLQEPEALPPPTEGEGV